MICVKEKRTAIGLNGAIHYGSSFMNKNSPGRRKFIRNVVLAAVAAPLLQRQLSNPVQAAPPRLPTTNAQAKALGYVEDATKVTAANFKPGSDCANCQFFTTANETCSIFPGFTVEPKGWCTAWAARKP